jgi:protein TonB
MLELREKPVVSASRVVLENKQPRRLMLALVLLLVALGGVLVRDRQFWFGTSESLEDEPEVAHRAVATSVPKTPARPVITGKKQVAAAAKNSAEPKSADAPAVTTTRTVLPPLDVEVVAGDAHRTVHPGSNSTKVAIPNSAAGAQSASTFAPATTAAERERLSTNAAPEAAQPATSYPLLAQHMDVRGSVVLLAVIGADGIIQNLRVLSGPGILTPAAQQAVREWRFKPIIQNGQAVESQAKITVNFNIKVADGSTNPTLAESRADDIRILSR